MTVVDQTYRRMLGRLPSAGEQRLLRQRMPAMPSAKDWEDFIWAMALHPEFQLIR
jgi:hypothetical protein